MDKGYYRLVPYRFFLNEDGDRCKLEKLINLFPSMKSVIELGEKDLFSIEEKARRSFRLEFFKSNHLSKLIDRLSKIYSLVSVLDVRDDTMHVFLGPYHLCLGPAMAGAYRFKYLSNLLLASAKSKPRGRDRARRSEFVLRRFRRLVKKLIMIKTILHQLRLTSILTPYNQYELIQNGIYDLVLAGHQSNASSIFNETSFVTEIENLRPLNHPDETSFLLATNFIKMNTLLQLLSQPPAAAQTEEIQRSAQLPGTPKVEHGEETNRLCCAQHNQYTPMIVFPLKSPVVEQTSQLTSKPLRSRVNSAHSSSQRSLAFLSRQNTATSQPESNISEGEKQTNEEDRLVDQIGLILSNFLLSRNENSKLNEDIGQLMSRIKTNVEKNLNEPKSKSRLTLADRRKTFSNRRKSFQDASVGNDKRIVSTKSQSVDEFN